jgi:Uma2 family endonuclease
MSITSVPPKLVLGLEHAGLLMTPEEFDEIEEYDENYRYELVHGVLVVTPIPLAEETEPNEYLGYLLRFYKAQHPQGAALDATLPQQYVPTRTSRRLADRLIWAGLGRLPHRLRDVPTIAVEFVSAGRRNRERDYTDKRHEYMEVGLGEYWIIDRFQRRMTVVRNDPAGPQETVVPENGTYTTRLLPGFELRLADVLAVADAWARAQH